jgi:hypothetical protein
MGRESRSCESFWRFLPDRWLVRSSEFRGAARVLALGLALGLRGLAPVHAASPDPFDRLGAFSSRLERLRLVFDGPESRVAQAHEVSIGPEGGRVTFRFQDGGSLTLALDHGQVLVGGTALGRYPAGGALDLAWDQLLRELGRLSTPDALDALRGWHPEGLSRGEQAAIAAFRDRLGAVSAPSDLGAAAQVIPPAPDGGLVIPLDDLRNTARLEPLLRRAAELRGSQLRLTVPNGRARLGPYGVGSGERLAGHLLVLHGDAQVFGTVEGNVAAVDGNIVVHPGGVVTGDVLAVSGEVRDLGGEIQGEVETLALTPTPTRPGPVEPARAGARERFLLNGAGVTGGVVTLLLVGFGLVLFARPPLEIMSDTALHSFGRSFLVGLLGQVLVLPTFGAIIVGLVLSVAGILLVPFVAIVFALLFVAALLGGFLAIAHAMGETVTRRQLAQGLALRHANSYRYVAVGVLSLAALWYAWVVFSWVPVAGSLIFAAAILVTWLLATVGFGAALLSRIGLREHFAGRLIPQEALTDEYLWATPQFGVKAVKRPEPAARSD